MQKQVPTKAPAKGAGRKKIVLGAVMVVVAGLAFCWGRSGAQSQTPAAPPAKIPSILNAPPLPSDYSRRVVAHIFNNIPITREELGEYLIARFGAERLENLVNRRIIELACQSKGITVTDAEVDAALKDDLAGLKLQKKDFVEKVLKSYGKTEYEWREDVLRPKVAITKYCRDQIKVAPEELQKAFEANFGEKVECRIIVIPKDNNNRHDFELYEKVRNSEKEFDSAARSQALAPLAAQGGEMPPIHRHYPDLQMEKEAFSLNPGEVSKLLTMPDGSRAILKCVRRIPANTTVEFEKVRADLYRDVTEAKLRQMVPQMFQKWRGEANPQIYLKRDRQEVAHRPAAPVTPASATSTSNTPAAPAATVGEQKKQ